MKMLEGSQGENTTVLLKQRCCSGWEQHRFSFPNPGIRMIFGAAWLAPEILFVQQLFYLNIFSILYLIHGVTDADGITVFIKHDFTKRSLCNLCMQYLRNSLVIR